jgi:methyl-accepting chemotaxis protein
MAVRVKLGVSAKIIGVVVAVVAVVVGVNYAVFMTGYRHDAEEALMAKAAAFTAVAEEAKNHQSHLLSIGAVDAKTLVAEAVEDVGKGKSYRDTRFFGAIPVVVGWTAAEKAAKEEGLDFKVIAFEARNKDNTPPAGSFREALLRDLETQVSNGGTSTLGRIDREQNRLHFLRAIKLDATCMACHGDPATYDRRDADGSFDGKDVLGFKMEGWKPGDTHGAYEVVMPLDTADQQVAAFFTTGMMWTVPLVLLACGSFVVLVRILLGRPVSAMVESMRAVAEGDLTRRVNIERADEIGQLAHWFDELTVSFQKILREVSGSAREVAAGSTQIAAAAEETAAAIREVAQQSSKASDSAADSGRLASEGGNLVAQTVEGMKKIDEVVHRSATSVAGLGERGKQIGQVVEVINDIADQTNLLALNAAIEAARAGEHGRGFAVVADEVRKLAERTTKATEEIAESIAAIQKEIGSAVEEMNAGTGEVRTGVERSAVAGSSLEKIVAGAKAVESMIQSISSATAEVEAGAGESAQAAGQLSAKAEQLQELVSMFKVDEAGPTTAVSERRAKLASAAKGTFAA